MKKLFQKWMEFNRQAFASYCETMEIYALAQAQAFKPRKK
jgi:hypothetical protein